VSEADELPALLVRPDEEWQPGRVRVVKIVREPCQLLGTLGVRTQEECDAV
jgi:hypothetical protein